VVVVVPVLVAGAVLAGPVLALAAVSKKMQDDYHEATSQLKSRVMLQEVARSQAAIQDREASQAALRLAELTKLQDSDNATLTMIENSIRQLAERLQAMPVVSKDLTVRCQSLLAALANRPEDALTVLDEYFRISQEIGSLQTVPIVATRRPEAQLRDALTTLRSEVLSPALDSPPCARIRQGFLASLDALDHLVDREPKVAAQGVKALRERIHRELRDQIDCSRKQAQASLEIRKATVSILAHLTAVEKAPELAGFHQQAATIRKKLVAALASPDLSVRSITGLADSAESLYNECQGFLQSQVQIAYIEQQVREVLLGMGYKVGRPAASDNSAILAEIDPGMGLEVRMDRVGNLVTEMVAFSQSTADVNLSKQEKVCAITDDLMRQLRSRELGVREKFRSHKKSGQSLRVVESPIAANDQQTSAISEPRLLRRDQNG